MEDVHWKRLGPGAEHVFASASSDRSVRVWDCREKSRSKAATCISEAHGSDVNVLSWSPCVGELLVTGADDGGAWVNSLILHALSIKNRNIAEIVPEKYD